MKTYVSIHEVGTLEAHAPGSLGAPLIITLVGTDHLPCGSVTLFLGDQVLVDNMANAINGAVAHKCPPDPAHEEAHNAAAVYDYRGSER